MAEREAFSWKPDDIEILSAEEAAKLPASGFAEDDEVPAWPDDEDEDTE